MTVGGLSDSRRVRCRYIPIRQSCKNGVCPSCLRPGPDGPARLRHAPAKRGEARPGVAPGDPGIVRTALPVGLFRPLGFDTLCFLR